MDDKTSGQRSTGKTANDVLIDHAARMWDSERENAARIEERINLTAAGIIAPLGLGSFGFVWTFQEPSHAMVPPFITLVTHLLLVAGVLLFAAALAIFYTGPSASGSATEKLEIVPSDDKSLPTRTIVFEKTYRAYLSLKKSNAKHRLRLRRGQVMFVWGMITVFLSVILYLTGSIRTKMHPEVIEHEHHSSQEKSS